MIKSKKIYFTWLVILFALLQIVIVSFTYKLKAPEEFNLMLHYLATNSTMRWIIIIAALMTVAASVFFAVLFANLFNFLSRRVLSGSDSSNDYKIIFLWFFIISSLQLILTTIDIKVISHPLPLMYIVAILFLAWCLIKKTKNAFGTGVILIVAALLQGLVTLLF